MKVLLVCAHPRPDSLTHAVAAAAVTGCERAGDDVTVLDLYAIGFRAAMSREERVAYDTSEPLIDPLTVEHAELVKGAEMLVLVYPTWWSSLPAILKGWLERVLVEGVAFHFDERRRVRPSLTNLHRVVGVSTYGSPWWVTKMGQDGGRRIVLRSVRMAMGKDTKTTWLGLHSVDTSAEPEREAFLDRVEHTMAHLKRPGSARAARQEGAS